MTTDRLGIIGVAGTMPKMEDPGASEEPGLVDGPTVPGNTTPPEEPTKPDEDTNVPDEDITVPDEDTTVPDEDAKPDGDTTVPDEDAKPDEGTNSDDNTGTDGAQGEGSDQTQPNEGTKRYTTTGEDGVQVTLSTGIDLPEDSLTVQSVSLSDAIKNQLGISDKDIWLEKIYNVGFSADVTGEAEEIADVPNQEQPAEADPVHSRRI